MSKLEELRKLREQLNIKINGIENYPMDTPNVIVSNHNCLMDIFYLPIAIPEDMVSLISARLMFKKELDRQVMINKYLNAIPIEVHGGKVYSELCLKNATEMLCNNISVGIFPEGAYVEENIIYRGRTGASRILFEGRKKGLIPNLVPVAIKVENEKLDMDSYTPSKDNRVEITIMKPIEYEEYYEKFASSSDAIERNKALHLPIDLSMIGIAQTLDKDYVNEYIELWPRTSMIFPDGTTIPIDMTEQEELIKRYESDLKNASKRLIKIL